MRPRVAVVQFEYVTPVVVVADVISVQFTLSLLTCQVYVLNKEPEATVKDALPNNAVLAAEGCVVIGFAGQSTVSVAPVLLMVQPPAIEVNRNKYPDKVFVGEVNTKE